MEAKQFKPKHGEAYWYIFWNARSLTPYVGSSSWMGDSLDYMKLYSGNVFRTKEEAEESKWNLIKKLGAI